MLWREGGGEKESISDDASLGTKSPPVCQQVLLVHAGGTTGHQAAMIKACAQAQSFKEKDLGDSEQWPCQGLRGEKAAPGSSSQGARVASQLVLSWSQ